MEHIFFLTDKELFLLNVKDQIKIAKQFLIDDLISSPETFKKEIIREEEGLIVIPDYWITSRFYPLETKRRSIIEEFLKRRLPSDFPEIPDSKDFFEYVFLKQQENRGILVYLILESLFYSLYRDLFSDILIEKITAPAFLWKAKLSKKFEIDKETILFMHIYHRNAYLCFFSDSCFLFSRLIDIDEETYINQISYEAMQSFRLVSQRTKKEIKKIYIIPKSEKDKERLANILNIEVEDIRDKIYLSNPEASIVEKVGTFAFLDKSDILNSAFYIPYRPIRRLKEWFFFQNTGIIVGVLVFIIMLVETLFFHRIFPPLPKEKKEKYIYVQDYISYLDEIISHEKRPDFSLVLLRILNCIPDYVHLTDIKIKSEPLNIELIGYVDAHSIEEFQDRFSAFLNKLRKNFKNTKIPRLSEIDIKKKKEGFGFSFGFDINGGQI